MSECAKSWAKRETAYLSPLLCCFNLRKHCQGTERSSLLKNDLPSNRYRVVRDMNSPRVEQKVKTAELSPLLCLNLHTLWRRGTFLLPNKHDLLNRQTELSEIWTRQKPSIKRNRPSIFLPALLEFIIQNWTKKIELWLSPQSFCKSFIHCICISILA